MLTVYWAQAQKISGLGPFKIGRSKELIDSLQLDGYKVFESSMSDYVVRFKSMFYSNAAFDLHTQNLIAIIPSAVPDQKLFVISKVEIAGIRFERMELRFYKDTLYYIGLKELPYNLISALKLKYKYSESPLLGITSIETSRKFTVTNYTFEAPDNLQCKAKDYDFSIGSDSPGYEYRFLIAYMPTFNIIEKYEGEQQKIKEAEKRKQLEGL